MKQAATMRCRECGHEYLITPAAVEIVGGELHRWMGSAYDFCEACDGAAEEVPPFTERRAWHQTGLDPWTWRWLHCLHNMPTRGYPRPAEQYFDAGYCLDRYSIESPNGDVRMSRP